DGIRDGHVTGVQTCALPISTRTLGSKRETSSFLMRAGSGARQLAAPQATARARLRSKGRPAAVANAKPARAESPQPTVDLARNEIGRASCRERGEVEGGDGG